MTETYTTRTPGRALAAAVLTAAVLATSPLAHAVDYSWNPGNAAVPSGGTGNWNLGDAFWGPNPAIVWPNTGTDGAIFAGTAGTVTITDPAVVAASLNFTTAGYTLNLGGTTQNLNTLSQNFASGTTAITNGSITMNAPTANFAIGGGTTAGNTTTLDLSGLSSFSFTGGSTRRFDVTTAGVTNSSSTVVRLSAGTNFISGTKPAGAATNLPEAGVTIGGATASAGTGPFNSTLQLGATNTINADVMTIGAFNGRGTVNFQTGLTGTPSLTLRGLAGGTSRMNLFVGQTSSGVRDGSGTLDLTGGTLDARLDRLIVGIHYSGANAPNPVNTLTMNAGTLDANSIVVAQKSNGGGPTVTSTFNQGGGTVTSPVLTLGRASSVNGAPSGAAGTDGAATFNATYALSGGTLNVGTINAVGIPGLTAVPGSTRRVNFSGGTIANLDAGTDLTINGIAAGVDATRPNAYLQVIASGAGAKNLDVSAGRLMTFGADSTLTGAGVTVNKTGLGTLALNQATSAFPQFGGANNVTVDLNVTGGTVRGTAVSTGSVTTALGTTIAPGNSIGTITFGSAILDGLLAVEYADSGAGTADGSIDKLVVTGALDIAGASVAFTDFAPVSVLNDNAYVFASYGTLLGTFVGVAPAGYVIDYAYNDGATSTNIALVPVPEPTGLAMLAIAGLPLLRRRRPNAA